MWASRRRRPETQGCGWGLQGVPASIVGSPGPQTPPEKPKPHPWSRQGSFLWKSGCEGKSQAGWHPCKSQQLVQEWGSPGREQPSPSSEPRLQSLPTRVRPAQSTSYVSLLPTCWGNSRQACKPVVLGWMRVSVFLPTGPEPGAKGSDRFPKHAVKPSLGVCRTQYPSCPAPCPLHGNHGLVPSVQQGLQVGLGSAVPQTAPSAWRT